MYRDDKLEKKGYIKEVHAMTYSEALAITGSASSTNNSIRTTGAFYILASARGGDSPYYMCYVKVNGGIADVNINSNNNRICAGIRPVVELNDGVYIASGDGTEESPYILAKE